MAGHVPTGEPQCAEPGSAPSCPHPAASAAQTTAPSQAAPQPDLATSWQRVHHRHTWAAPTAPRPQCRAMELGPAAACADPELPMERDLLLTHPTPAPGSSAGQEGSVCRTISPAKGSAWPNSPLCLPQRSPEPCQSQAAGGAAAGPGAACGRTQHSKSPRDTVGTGGGLAAHETRMKPQAKQAEAPCLAHLIPRSHRMWGQEHPRVAQTHAGS